MATFVIPNVRKMKLAKASLLSASLLMCACGPKQTYEYPFLNPKLSVDERVDNLLSLLTPEEKISLMMSSSVSIDRLGIPAYNWWGEACHGICAADATVFPQSIGLAATFDEPQQFEIYTAVSDEARAMWNTTDHNEFGVTRNREYMWDRGLTFWCPNVNIVRDPRWGRGQETSGEDPYLSGTMGAATVRGMQGSDRKYYKTFACVKHFAVHSGPDGERDRFNATASMRDLWETYLPAFKTIVMDAQVQEVMCAYNRYEGEPCCGSDRLLGDILRNKWNYKGIVLSDCSAINFFYQRGRHETHPDAPSASADAVLSGTDLECGTSYASLKQSLEKGLISEADLDVSLRRLLSGRIKLGMFDPAEKLPWAGLGADVISSPEHTALARKAAREAMVLLKNNGVLPLSKSVRKIAVVGPNADNVSMHNGNYNGTPTAQNTVSILEAIRRAAPQAEIIYEKGCELKDPFMTDHKTALINRGKGLHAEFWNNREFSGAPVAVKDLQQVNLSTFGDYLFAENVESTNFSTRLSGTYVADFTGDLSYLLRVSGGYRFLVNGKEVSSQEEVAGGRGGRGGFGGFGGFGGGQREYKFPVVEGQSYDLCFEYTKGDQGYASLSLDFCKIGPPDYNMVADKVKDADVIIMVGGLSAQIEGEGSDRKDIELPEVQKSLLKALDGTGKPVVFVNCTGSAIAFTDFENRYDALLQAWYSGQATGLAVADVLFGDYNPAGRLPLTFYKSTDELPDIHDYSMEGRTYRYFKGEPMYAFGYGLSYTSFEYGEAKLSSSQAKAGKGVTITVPVTNTGSLDGDEVVQIYVKSLDNPTAPIKSLKGFSRVNIKAGQTASVKIALDASAFEYYDSQVDGLSPFKGRYRILYGPSSLDKDLKSVDFVLK